MTPPAIAAVVFDMDGVIFDTEKLYFAAQDELLRRRHHRYTPELALRIMGMPGVPAMEVVREALGLDDPAQALYDESQVLFQSLLPTELQMMDGALDLLETARGCGLPVAVATSTKRDLAMRMLDAFDLPRRFDAILTFDDVAHGKPHPEMYQKACAALGVEPASALVIEDSVNGVTSALAAGCYTVGVRHEHNQTIDFPPVAFIAESMRDSRLHELVKSACEQLPSARG
jgi:HAD superfamily hydrolase (TIGR01509 family)